MDYKISEFLYICDEFKNIIDKNVMYYGIRKMRFKDNINIDYNNKIFNIYGIKIKYEDENYIFVIIKYGNLKYEFSGGIILYDPDIFEIDEIDDINDIDDIDDINDIDDIDFPDIPIFENCCISLIFDYSIANNMCFYGYQMKYNNLIFMIFGDNNLNSYCSNFIFNSRENIIINNKYMVELNDKIVNIFKNVLGIEDKPHLSFIETDTDIVHDVNFFKYFDIENIYFDMIINTIIDDMILTLIVSRDEILMILVKNIKNVPYKCLLKSDALCSYQFKMIDFNEEEMIESIKTSILMIRNTNDN